MYFLHLVILNASASVYCICRDTLGLSEVTLKSYNDCSDKLSELTVITVCSVYCGDKSEFTTIPSIGYIQLQSFPLCSISYNV
jgi:hypothetical protein